MKAKKNTFDEHDFNKFYKYSLSLTNNEDNAYDLLQTSLEKFLKKQGHDKEFPNSYLYTIIKNQFIDDKRRENRWKMQSIDDRNSKISIVDLESLNEEKIVSESQVKRIISMVDDDERELLFLWAVEGHSIRSIAEKTNIPRGTLLSQLQRIKKQLRRLLIKDYPEFNLGN